MDIAAARETPRGQSASKSVAAPISEKDLYTALQAASREQGLDAQMHALYRVAKDFRSADFIRALAVLGGGAMEDAKALRAALVAFWLERDLPAARAWVAALPPEERAVIFPSLVETWGRLNSRDLRAWLSDFPPAETARLVKRVRSEIAVAFVRADPEMALEFLATSANSLDGEEYSHREAYWAAFQEWGERDPVAAAARLLELPGKVRSRAIYGLVESWVVHDPAAAEEWIDSLTDVPLIVGGVESFIGKRAETNPRAAAEFLIRHRQWLPQTMENGIQMMNRVTSAWANEDELAALAWVKAFPDEDLKGQGMYDVLRSVSYRDPSRAADLWVAEYGDREDFSGWSSASYVARDLAGEKGFPAGIEFIGQLHEKLRIDVADEFIQEGGGGAVEMAESVLQLPASEFRADFIRPVFHKLASAGEFGEAQRMAAALPPGPERDAAVSGYLAGQLQRDPDSALRFLETIDPSTAGRELLLSSLAKDSRRPNQALETWLKNTAALSAEEKLRVASMRREAKR